MPSNDTTKTWLSTGAGRGMGVDFAQAALAAGHHVVATGRNPEAVAHEVAGSPRAGTSLPWSSRCMLSAWS